MLTQGLDSLLQTLADQEGRDLTAAEVETAAHEYFMAKSVTKSTFKSDFLPDRLIKLFGLDDDDVTAFQDIDRDDRIEIIDELNAERIPVSPRAIIDRYLKKKAKK